MKMWKSAELAELNINETANGFLNLGFESPFNIISHGDKCHAKEEKPVTPDVNPVVPVTPDTPVNDDVVTDRLS